MARRRARREEGPRGAGGRPRAARIHRRRPHAKQLVVDEREAATVRWFFREAARGKSTTELINEAKTLGLHAKTHGEWSARAVLRLLRNLVYMGRRPDGGPAVHAALVPADLFERVQAAIAGRRTRATKTRSRPDEREDPFILRGLLVCERCGRMMTTSMSVSMAKKTARKAPRYYRCRTEGCDGGQVAAAEVEAMALEALRRPERSWPAWAKERMAQIASTWDVLWPLNRRRALAYVFAKMTWRARTRRLLVRMNDEASPGTKP